MTQSRMGVMALWAPGCVGLGQVTVGGFYFTIRVIKPQCFVCEDELLFDNAGLWMQSWVHP